MLNNKTEGSWLGALPLLKECLGTSYWWWAISLCIFFGVFLHYYYYYFHFLFCFIKLSLSQSFFLILFFIPLRENEQTAEWCLAACYDKPQYPVSWQKDKNCCSGTVQKWSLMKPRMTLAFLAVSAHCWLTFNFLSTRTPWSFSAQLLSSWVAPSMSWYLELFLPMCKSLHFSLLNFMKFLSALFTHLLHQKAAQNRLLNSQEKVILYCCYDNWMA